MLVIALCHKMIYTVSYAFHLISLSYLQEYVLLVLVTIRQSFSETMQ